MKRKTRSGRAMGFYHTKYYYEWYTIWHVKSNNFCIVNIENQNYSEKKSSCYSPKKKIGIQNSKMNSVQSPVLLRFISFRIACHVWQTSHDESNRRCKNSFGSQSVFNFELSSFEKFRLLWVLFLCVYGHIIKCSKFLTFIFNIIWTVINWALTFLWNASYN